VDGSAAGAENGASPLCFCGASRSPESPEVVEDAAGRENALSEEPMIMPRSIKIFPPTEGSIILSRFSVF
jgi:hypothetical protein